MAETFVWWALRSAETSTNGRFWPISSLARMALHTRCVYFDRMFDRRVFMNRFGILVASFALLAMPSLAQDQTATQPPLHITTDRIQVLGSGPSQSDMMYMLQDGPGKAGEGQIAFFSAEVALNHELTKNAPYTATAVTESTQTLADGTHISSKTSAFLARDSQGRTRREEVFGKVGPLHVEGPKLVFINDPVANTEYILEPADQSARILKPETINLDKNEPALGIRIERRTHEEGRVLG